MDAEHGRNRKTNHSNEGQVILLNGNLVSWSFKGQTIVAANPYHAEVIALSNGTRHLNIIRHYIIGCGNEDNQAVVRYARGIGLAKALRTLAQHFHFGRDQQQLGLIDVRNVPALRGQPGRFFHQTIGQDQVSAQRRPAWNAIRRGLHAATG